MKKCPNCKKNMSDNSAFCDICGTPLTGERMTEELSSITTIPTIPEKKSSKPKTKKRPKGRPRMEPPKEPTITPQTQPAAIPFAEPKMPELEKVVEIDHYHPEPLEEEEPFVEKKKNTTEKKLKSKKSKPPKIEKEEEQQEDFVEVTDIPEEETNEKATVPTTKQSFEGIKTVETIPRFKPVVEAIPVAKIVTEPPIEAIPIAKIVTEPPIEEIPVAKIVKETSPETTPTVPETPPVVKIPEIKTNPVTVPITEPPTMPPATEPPTTVPITQAPLTIPQPPMTAPITQPVTVPAPTVPIVTTPAATIPVIVTTPVVAMPTTVIQQVTVPPTAPPVPKTNAPVVVPAQTTPQQVVAPPVNTVQQAPLPQQTIPQSLAALYGEPTRPMPMASTIPQTTPVVKKEIEKDSKASSSIILGIASLLLCGMLPVAIVGFILGYMAKIDMKKRKMGMILNAIAIVYGVIALIVFCHILTPGSEIINDPNKESSNTFAGSGYTLTYNEKWETTTLSGGTIALKYDGKQAFFSPIGETILSETVSCNFEDENCKTTVYDEFYEYWRKDIDQSLVLAKDATFASLKDKIYYATYSYTLKSTGELKGKYYLLVATEDDIILSFLTNADEDYMSKLNPEVMTLLETIKINKNGTTSGTNQTIESLSTWNDFPELRSNIPSLNRTLYGEYRILSNDSNSYWKFKNGEFWWYKDEHQLEDNYWYGTMAVASGKKGIKSVGLPESKLEEILDQYQGNVRSSDIYSIVMKPQKIISNGVDKTATNLPKGQELRLIWILVDHKEEGIEAQVLNVDSDATDYFVKVKD